MAQQQKRDDRKRKRLDNIPSSDRQQKGNDNAASSTGDRGVQVSPLPFNVSIMFYLEFYIHFGLHSCNVNLTLFFLCSARSIFSSCRPTFVNLASWPTLLYAVTWKTDSLLE